MTVRDPRGDAMSALCERLDFTEKLLMRGDEGLSVLWLAPFEERKWIHARL